MNNKIISLAAVLFFLLSTFSARAQFEAPKFKKITHAQRAYFTTHYINKIKQTGRGLYGDSKLDTVKTIELRARLQAAFGDPTQTIQDLVHRRNFRPGMAIEFEYWFVVDDSIPLIVLDEKGPFGYELVYSGASRYVDLMPQIMRTFSNTLMNVKDLGAFQDYYYSADREKWYDVRYQNGTFSTKQIGTPPGISYPGH